MTQLIHLNEGGDTSSLDMTGTFPGRSSIPSGASGSELRGWGGGSGEVRVAEHIPTPYMPQGYDRYLKTIPGCGHQTQEPLKGNPTSRKSFGCCSVLLD